MNYMSVLFYNKNFKKPSEILFPTFFRGYPNQRECKLGNLQFEFGYSSGYMYVCMPVAYSLTMDILLFYAHFRALYMYISEMQRTMKNHRYTIQNIIPYIDKNIQYFVTL